MTKLTATQQKALALDKNISVTAGAGSGKTAILVERFLKIVSRDAGKVRRVLAITFTKKAVAEMRERVAEQINKLLDKSPAQEQNKLLQVRDHLNSASISTIHSFCASVLREFPLEAGLAPDFNEMDELRSEVFKYEAVDRAFESLEQLPQDKETDWMSFFLALNTAKIRKALKAMLDKPYEMEQIESRFGQMKEEDWRSFLHNIWLEKIRQIVQPWVVEEAIGQAGSILRDCPVPSHEDGSTVHRLLTQFVREQKTANEIEKYKILVRVIQTFTTQKGTAYKNLGKLGTNAGWPQEKRALLVELSEFCAQWAPQILQAGLAPPPGEEDEQWFKYFRMLLHLYEITREDYTRQKKEIGVVDYEDLLLLTLHLLRSNEAVRSELASRFDFIMVDEFQDTNELQWEIIRLLAVENGEPAGDKVFIVGDPKQSIYAFRNADVRVFKNVKRDFARSAGHSDVKQYAGNIIFEDSFRFLPVLNGFINFVFSHILQEDPANPFTVEYNPLVSKRELPGKGQIELALLESEQPVKEEALYMARSIRYLLDNKITCFKWREDKEEETDIKYGDIAILLRGRTHLLQIEQTLRDHGIPFKTVSGIGFWQKQEIYDFYHILRFLNSPDDDFALLAVLRSTFFIIADHILLRFTQMPGDTLVEKLRQFTAQTDATAQDEETNALLKAAVLIDKWLHLRERLPLEDLLHRIIDDLRLRSVLAAQINGEQLIANIDKLIEAAQGFSSSGAGGLSDFLYYLEDLMDKSEKEGEAPLIQEDDSTVKIITIHSAKGLQFPVVFLPFLNQGKSGRSSGIYLEPENGLAVNLAGENNNAGFYYYRHLRRIARQREEAEKRRLFYVAITRARDYLFLSAAIKNNKPEDNTPLAWLQESFLKGEYDLFAEESIEHPDFKLRIVRQVPPVEKEEKESTGFFKEVEQLEQFVRDYRPVPKEAAPLEGGMGAIVFSATRIMTYLHDPQEYYRRYHLGFFEHDYEVFARDIYKSDLSLLKGKLVHRYLELLDQSPADREALIHNILFEYEVYDEKLRREFFDELRETEQRALESEKGRKILHAAEARNETSITVRLGEDFLTGSIDRLYRNEQGLWEVVDYKTNRINPTALNREAKKYEWQMKTYALQVSRLYPQQEVYPVSLYFLHPDLLYKVEYSREEIEKITDELLQTIREIKTKFPFIAS